MGTDYEEYYKTEGPGALGPPGKFVTSYFEKNMHPRLNVLDVGCGQGRDALFIAGMGHKVHGLDISPTGIAQMLATAQTGDLDVTGEVADIVTWRTDARYDIILLDRVLHMLPEAPRLRAMACMVGHLAKGGVILLSDEAPNVPALIKMATETNPVLAILRQQKGNVVLG